MAFGTLIRKDFPLQSGDRECADLHARMRALLAEEVGQEISSLFAAPVVGVEGDGVWWHADSSAPAIPAVQLPPPHLLALEERLRQRMAPALDWAHRTMLEEDVARVECARLVVNLAATTNKSALYEVGGEPVLAELDNVRPASLRNEERLSVQRRLMAVDVFIAARARWVAAVAALGVFGFVVTAGLTLAGVLPNRSAVEGRIAVVPNNPSPISSQSVQLREETEREVGLRVRLNELIAHLADRRQSCVPVQPAPSATRPLRRRRSHAPSPRRRADARGNTR